MAIRDIINVGMGFDVYQLPVLGFLASNAVAGPYCVAASQIYLAGATRGQVYKAGANEGQLYLAGAKKGQVCR